MGQSYQPDFDKLIQGQSNDLSEAEIMAEIRKVMVAETVVHPEVVVVKGQAPEPRVLIEPQTESPAKTVARRFTGYQPRWSHNLMILSLAAILYSPVGVAAVMALSLAALVLLYWAAGADRVAAVGRVCFGLCHRVFPTQADRALDWANRVSDRVQALSNRLPARLTQGLYLPSFASEPVSNMDQVEPFDRLLARRQGDQQTTAE
jgi:hypothetical protein